MNQKNKVVLNFNNAFKDVDSFLGLPSFMDNKVATVSYEFFLGKPYKCTYNKSGQIISKEPMITTMSNDGYWMLTPSIENEHIRAAEEKKALQEYNNLEEEKKIKRNKILLLCH